MRLQTRFTLITAICLMASAAHADEQGFGTCKAGFADDTRVRTESRGDMTIGQVRVSDRVWAFDERVGKPGWSKVLQRVEGERDYKLLSDFSEPGSAVVSKACWLIKRTS